MGDAFKEALKKSTLVKIVLVENEGLEVVFTCQFNPFQQLWIGLKNTPVVQEIEGVQKVLFGADDFNFGHTDDHNHPLAGWLPDAVSKHRAIPRHSRPRAAGTKRKRLLQGQFLLP